MSVTYISPRLSVSITGFACKSTVSMTVDYMCMYMVCTSLLLLAFSVVVVVRSRECIVVVNAATLLPSFYIKSEYALYVVTLITHAQHTCTQAKVIHITHSFAISVILSAR